MSETGDSGEYIKVNIVEANKETLEGFGKIVTDFDKEEVEITPWPVSGWRKLCPGTGQNGGILSGDFIVKWEGKKCVATKIAVNEDYTTGRLPVGVTFLNRTHVLVREAKYHPDSGHVIYPREMTPFVALLAPPGDDVKLEDFVAFYFDGSFGLQIHPNVWHQAMYPINDQALFLSKQGAVHASVKLDTVNECGNYLLVPLQLNS